MIQLANGITRNTKIRTGVGSHMTVVHGIDEQYTEETCRCLTFIVQQTKKGLSFETVANQAISSYGLWIYDRACLGLKRYFERNK